MKNWVLGRDGDGGESGCGRFMLRVSAPLRVIETVISARLRSSWGSPRPGSLEGLH